MEKELNFKNIIDNYISVFNDDNIRRNKQVSEINKSLRKAYLYSDLQNISKLEENLYDTNSDNFANEKDNELFIKWLSNKYNQYLLQKNYDNLKTKQCSDLFFSCEFDSRKETYIYGR